MHLCNVNVAFVLKCRKFHPQTIINPRHACTARVTVAGVSGKTWRLIKDWYTDVRSSVRVGRQVSPSFSVSRGVRQGSVLSPTLFMLVIDPILLELSKRSCGPSVCGTLGPSPMRTIFEHSPPTFPTGSYRWRWSVSMPPLKVWL